MKKFFFFASFFSVGFVFAQFNTSTVTSNGVGNLDYIYQVGLSNSSTVLQDGQMDPLAALTT
jgi:parvulin-like peptidyl-prolyl isomerase